MAYLYRLLCLSLASFFLIHSFSGLIVKILERKLTRRAERVSAAAAARLLFTVRLLPSSFAGAVVTLLCVPSYLWLEPHAWSETVGPWCLVAAVLGATICALSALRAARALIGSIRYQRVHLQAKCGADSQSAASRGALSGSGTLGPIWITDSPSPTLALAGIFRAKLLISRQAFGALSAEELRAAIRHERAHQASRDNLKRLILLLLPDILPFWPAFTSYDHAWARLTEWAADDRVAAAGPEQTLSLAAALVRVARLNAANPPVPLMTSLLSDVSGLSVRVDRLLSGRTPTALPIRRFPLAAPAIAASAALFAALAAQTTTLRFIHELLEQLIR